MPLADLEIRNASPRDKQYKLTDGGGLYLLVLMFKYRQGGDEWEPVEQRILLESTPCNYGSHRLWLVCPHCTRGCLVLCGAGRLFLCRQCYRLPHQTQLENEHGRACVKRNKLYEKLCGDNRPKTRERLFSQ
ncbi:Arm DNA-binding domain-containing protein [Litorivivens sp.]|uniref:Arm DNA-binding domain-containing protein n=1 Tax=Litorivivens sp. TaxID=2020868 RepID=UPI003564A1F6